MGSKRASSAPRWIRDATAEPSPEEAEPGSESGEPGSAASWRVGERVGVGGRITEGEGRLFSSRTHNASHDIWRCLS